MLQLIKKVFSFEEVSFSLLVVTSSTLEGFRAGNNIYFSYFSLKSNHDSLQWAFNNGQTLWQLVLTRENSKPFELYLNSLLVATCDSMP